MRNRDLYLVRYKSTYQTVYYPSDVYMVRNWANSGFYTRPVSM